MRHLLQCIGVVVLWGCVPVGGARLDERIEAQRLIDQGSAYLRVGDLTNAAASFQVAAEITVSAEAIDGLGCVDFLRGDIDAADLRFQEALDLNPRYGEALLHRAAIHEARGDIIGAEELFNQVIEADPKNVRARNNLAALLAKHGGESGRRLAYQELLKASALVPHPIIADNLRHMGSSE